MADEKLAFPREEILELYEDHPVREDRILERVEQERGDLEGLSEEDLAKTVSQIQASDQNHVGGLETLDRLARLCEIEAGTRVLDVGCGLGGGARRLAETHGARVLGIELSPERVRQARNLTELVGLEERVRFEAGDILEIDLPEERFDVVLCQASASHVRAKAELLDVLTHCLAPGGRLALEEPAARAEDDLARPEMKRLENLWKVALETVEGWRNLLRDAGFSITQEEDSSDDFLGHQEELLELAEAGCIEPPERERRAWEAAREQVRQGRLAYLRWVARRPLL